MSNLVRTSFSMCVSISGGEICRIGTPKSQGKGYVDLKFDSFCQIALHRVVPASAHTSKVWEHLFPVLCNTVYFQPFFIFAKPYVKSSISKLNLHFSHYEWCPKSFHMIKSQLCFLFCKLSVHIPVMFLILWTVCSYPIPIFLLSC